MLCLVFFYQKDCLRGQSCLGDGEYYSRGDDGREGTSYSNQNIYVTCDKGACNKVDFVARVKRW